MLGLGRSHERECLSWTGIDEVDEELNDLNAGYVIGADFAVAQGEAEKMVETMTLICDWKVAL